MKIKEWKEKADKQAEESISAAAASIRALEKDESQIRIMLALITATGMKCDYEQVRYAQFRNLKNFDGITRLMEAGDELGLEIEKWATNDYPASRNRDFHFTLPSGMTYTIAAYLAQDADCELVEIKRETREEITYELRCGGKDANKT